MKQILTFIFFLSCLVGLSQESQKGDDNLFWYEATCENGTEKAQTDFNNGKYNIFITGLTFSFKSEEEFYKFYDNYMLEKYSIKFVKKGCVITGSIKCYKETMEKLVLEKFGVDVFEKSRKEAKKEFEKI
ncbi:hypothetical protein SAMN06265349_102969 [Flavobacterium resistens]|uniref:Uncharacterized protein n=1 Tax=Flavobacterium resistens TaxID=443612 RepID=A0A521CVY3_9FLAO|nr:hypothetical protein [Flavobacterium resistens]MRX67035.1 hypothetical protein [Flavobacterium resistens]SMO63607.1 hypothetical protein SAMN06265349_102969 [Flavobacterium resistens]